MLERNRKYPECLAAAPVIVNMIDTHTALPHPRPTQIELVNLSPSGVHNQFNTRNCIALVLRMPWPDQF